MITYSVWQRCFRYDIFDKGLKMFYLLVGSSSRTTFINGFTCTLEPLYNTIHYNTVLDITWFKDGSQKCIDYIEK